MNKLFVHNAWFRLVAPIFCGILVYLLILLINDSVLFIQEDFLSQELFVCVGLAYLTQEFSRFSLVIFERLKWPKSFVWRVVLQVFTSMLLTVVLVTLAVYIYFTEILFYQPNPRELLVFNSIFSFITFLYVMLYLGYYFLFRRNTKKLEEEALIKRGIEADFTTYLKGINPQLLFESLEALLVTMKEDPDRAEELSDQFSIVYRYILSKRKRELVPVEEELEVTGTLIKLLNHLPFRKIKLERPKKMEGLILPTALLTIVEGIVRTTIAAKNKTLTISLIDHPEGLQLSYTPEEKLKESLTIEVLSEVVEGFGFYTEQKVSITNNSDLKIIELPKINYHESMHN